ncbi:hypothetical protein ADUPG1_002508, partial [Aduncisulcus paluster]
MVYDISDKDIFLEEVEELEEKTRAITDDKTRERDQQYLTNVLKVQEKWAGYSRVN